MRHGGGAGVGVHALSEMVPTAIEAHPNNAHLSNSAISDNLLWWDIVNCAYAYGRMCRPMSLGMPCALVKSRLERLGNELTHLVEAPMTMAESRSTRGDAHINSGGCTEPGWRRQK